MMYIRWKQSILLFVTTLSLFMQTASASKEQSEVSISIGITVNQLEKSSSYSFEGGAHLDKRGGASYLTPPSSPGWVINRPYDLKFKYKDLELREKNLGGDNFLTAISVSRQDKIVNHVQITFQNHPLALDEALSTARRLNKWFVAAGAHTRSVGSDMGRAAVPFYIENQERKASKYVRNIQTYEDARVAFLDPKAQVISMMPFDLETDDIYASLEIVNARRQREDLSIQKKETELTDEREYFLNLSVSARPADRYK